MNFYEISKSIKGKRREMIKDNITALMDYQRNFSKYKPEELKLLFSEWHKEFPQHQQDITCSSCRKAVVKFWKEIYSIWISEKKKVKKSSTRTGAMAKGVGTSK
jgi:hypothetical protein